MFGFFFFRAQTKPRPNITGTQYGIEKLGPIEIIPGAELGRRTQCKAVRCLVQVQDIMDANRQDGKTEEMPVVSSYGATFLIMIQVVSRGMTFVANQALLRYLSPETLGVATQLELYSITLLFFSRESIRIAVQRQPTDAIPSKDAGETPERSLAMQSKSVASQSAVNISYIPIALGIPFAFALGFSYIHLAEKDALQIPFFQTSLKIVGLASLLELITEPWFAIVQQKMIYRTRAIVETTASITKGLVTCGTAVWGYRAGLDVGVLPFATGQLAFACVLVLGYFAMVLPISGTEGFSMFLAPISPRCVTLNLLI